MPVTEAIQRIIMANGTELDIAIQAERKASMICVVPAC
jgi:hypothetical protein